MSFESSLDSSTFLHKKTKNVHYLRTWQNTAAEIMCYSEINTMTVALIFTDTEMDNEYGYSNDMAKNLLWSMQWNDD